MHASGPMYEFIVFGRPGCKHIICQVGVHVHDLANMSHEHMCVKKGTIASMTFGLKPKA